MTNPMLDQKALEAALDAANELVCGAGKPVRDYVSGIIRAYLAASSPVGVEPLIERVLDISNDEDLGPGTSEVRAALREAASSLTDLRQQVEALKGERDDAVARYAEATKEAGRLRDLAETRRLRQIWRYMNDDTYSRAEALAREVAELREAMTDITDEMVVAAMDHVPGCDHDDMVDALAAALAIRATSVAAKKDSSHG